MHDWKQFQDLMIKANFTNLLTMDYEFKKIYKNRIERGNFI